MAEKVYIAADGGGTKLLTVLYDGEFNILSPKQLGAVLFEKLRSSVGFLSLSEGRINRDDKDIKLTFRSSIVNIPVLFNSFIIRINYNS